MGYSQASVFGLLSGRRQSWDFCNGGGQELCRDRVKSHFCKVSVCTYIGFTLQCDNRSTSGVVNIYKNNQHAVNQVQTPIKELMHLTTTVDNVRINHDSQILAISSKEKKDSLRMVRLFLVVIDGQFLTLLFCRFTYRRVLYSLIGQHLAHLFVMLHLQISAKIVVSLAVVFAI